MQNQSPNWQFNMQKLQAATEGKDLRDQLIVCLNMCNESHMYNVGLSDFESGIIDWGGIVDCPPGTIPPLPGDWILDPHDHIYKMEGE